MVPGAASVPVARTAKGTSVEDLFQGHIGIAGFFQLAAQCLHHAALLIPDFDKLFGLFEGILVIAAALQDFQFCLQDKFLVSEVLHGLFVGIDDCLHLCKVIHLFIAADNPVLGIVIGLGLGFGGCKSLCGHAAKDDGGCQNRHKGHFFLHDVLLASL